MHDKIALVKTGWSEHYQGGPVLGRYSEIKKFGVAYERFNFLCHSDGFFYGYVPPIGGRPPQPEIKDGWLLIFVAAKNGNGPLTVVGWYDNATFHKEYAERPEYSTSEDFETDVDGTRYSYCIKSKNAHLIPTGSRTYTVSGDHFRMSSILYVRGNGKDDDWRRDLAEFAERLVDEPPEGESIIPKPAFPDPEKRTRVELAAVESAKMFLSGTYKLTDRQKLNCGYDFLARHKRTGDELHVEVKGTSGSNMHFYMSRNEYRYMANPKWRLLMVTDALTNKPKVILLNEKEVRRAFNFDELAWEAIAK